MRSGLDNLGRVEKAGYLVVFDDHAVWHQESLVVGRLHVVKAHIQERVARYGAHQIVEAVAGPDQLFALGIQTFGRHVAYQMRSGYYIQAEKATRDA